MESSRANDKTYSQHTLFSLLCKSGKFFPYIHATEANAVKFPCKENGRRNTITCEDKNLDEFLSEINSLDINTIHLNGVNLCLEEYIPVIPKKFFKSSATFVQQEIVAISLSDIFVSPPLNLKDRKYCVSPTLKINRRVLRNPIFQNKKVILLSDARDILLEHLWWNRTKMKLFDTLAKIGFYAISTPNFSLFKGECPVGHAWNIKKGLIYGEELEKRGVVVIPHIYAVHPNQLVRWCDWLKKHPSVKTVAMNCQLQRKSIVGRNIAVGALKHLLENTEVHIILHGSDKRITSQLKQFTARLHIASSGFFKNLEIKKQMSPFLYKSWIENTRKVSATP